jgi:hypothetical protein
MNGQIMPRSFAALFAVLSLLIEAPGISADETLPIFDAHVHYSEGAWVSYDPRAVIELMDRAGVTRALVSSTPDDGTLMLYKTNSARVVPELRPYRSSGDMIDWFRNPEVLAYVMDRLKSGIYRGIGEFHLLDESQVRTPQIARLVELAVGGDLVLHVHCDAGPVRALFALNPKLKILWAHAGVFASPAEIGALLDRYPTLWTELSLRALDIDPGAGLEPEWRALLLRHPTRFMIGTDTWTTSRWAEYVPLVQQHRAWLTQLPEAVAQNIAHRNAERVFGVHK